MEKVFNAILNHKKTVVIIFAISAITAYILSKTVAVNYDMMHYLPDDASSTKALQVMEDEYGGGIPCARIMVPDVTIPEALEIKDKIKAVDGVTDVTWLDNAVNINVPIETQYKDTVGNYYKDGYALYTVTIDYSKCISALNEIRGIVGSDASMSGSAVNTAVATTNTTSEIQKAVVIVVAICFIILFLTTTSWIEPVLMMVTIGIAIILNRGTNAFLGEISFVSNAAGSILQLAVSMDYSIFLLGRFTEYKKQGLPFKEAVLNAMKKSFSPIISGGLTAFTGFAVLAIMRFKIGPDLGSVLAKGIVLSLISVLTLLPVFLIYSEKLIAKTEHKPLAPKFKSFSKVALKARISIIALFILLIIPCFLAQNSNAFYYGSSKIFSDENSQVVKETKAIENEFGKANTLVLLVPNGDFNKESELSADLRKIPQITGIISYVNTVGVEIPTSYLSKDTLSKLISQNYSRFVLTVNTDYEGTEAFHVVEQIKSMANNLYGDKYLLAGESANTYDLMNIVKADKTHVEITAIAAIFLILLITFKSVSLPVILVAVIETAVWLNVSVPYFQNSTLFYLAYLIISTIQLGSTIDYAILLNDRYMEERRHHPKAKALHIATENSALPIITSGTILTAGGLTLGFIASNGVLRQLGILIGRGTVISTLLVLLVLPALFYVLDKLIQKTTKNMKFVNSVIEDEQQRTILHEKEYTL